MAEVTIREIADWVVMAHRARAESVGRNLEDELRSLLTKTARAHRNDFATKTAALRNRLRAQYGTLPESTPLIREDRDAIHALGRNA